MSEGLLASLAAGFGGDAARSALLDAALRGGLPGPRDEAWRYTTLRALERRSFRSASGTTPTTVDPARLAAIPAPRLVFVNGRHDASLSDLTGLAAGATLVTGGDTTPPPTSTAPAAQVFRRLNAALATDGAVLRIEAGAESAATLHLVDVGAPATDDLAWHLRHRIEVGTGARLTLVEHHLSAGAHRHFANARLALHVGAGAAVVHARAQAGAEGATALLHTEVVLADGADYRRVDLELGGGLSRHELDVHLAGAGARLVANGVQLAGGRRHTDTRLGIRHGAPDTTSTLRWRGIGAGRGRAVFHGGITIDAGADGSDADLSNRNLLLSADAAIDTQPVLVIHADEVKAAHGATVGQLDPASLFYLRSRGLPLAEARRLLTAAFVREPLAAIADAGLRDALQATLDAALSALDP